MKKNLIGRLNPLRVCFAIMFLAFIVYSIILTVTLRKTETKIDSMETLLADYRSQLEDYELQLHQQSNRIEACQNELKAADLKPANAFTLFDKYFGNINFSDGLDYNEIYEFNKQFAICNNVLNTDFVAEKGKLHLILNSKLEEAYFCAEDATKELVINQMLEELSDEIEIGLELYGQFLKEQTELRDYESSVPRPET